LDFTPFKNNPEQKPYNTEMASWIIHLRIAENLLGLFPDLDPAHFAVGNIAPDSGIPNENWEKFTPPPEVTHFSDSSGDQQNVAHIQQYYQRTDANVQALYNLPYIYLSAAQADGFVEASTRQISRIYKQLWIDGLPADGLVSALVLKF
jgi:hypothetical protein